MADVRCPLYEAAMISKHEPAIVCEERTLLYYELDDLASRLAARLRRGGIGPGHRVGLFLQQDWRYVALLLGILRAGAVACPLNTRLPPAQALELLKSINARDVIARVDAARRAALLEFRILDPDELLTRSADDRPLEWNEYMPLDRPATIVFTSGSTGDAKAVLHTYANHYYSAKGSNLNIRLRSHERWLLSIPLYHVGGLGIVFRCLLAGATIAIPEPDETIEQAQERMEVTQLSLVETQLYRLLRTAQLPKSFAKVNAVLLGGGPVSPALIKDALAAKLPVFMSYGLTEMASQVTAMRPDAPPPKRFTAGKLLKYRQLMLADDGEILVCGETLFSGYVKGDTVDPGLNDIGWFETGDIGALDADEYLTVLGRKDNMFISGGENIHPEEIERAISSCIGVETCLVVPVPDVEFGQRPAAFVKGNLKLAGALERVLPRFKVPNYFWPWPESAGNGLKPDRKVLSALALTLAAATSAGGAGSAAPTSR